MTEAIGRSRALWNRDAVDLRSEAGLLKSTLLHRLDLVSVPWGHLIDAQAGRGTFREVWRLAWAPEFSVRLAEIDATLLVHDTALREIFEKLLPFLDEPAENEKPKRQIGFHVKDAAAK